MVLAGVGLVGGMDGGGRKGGDSGGGARGWGGTGSATGSMAVAARGALLGLRRSHQHLMRGLLYGLVSLQSTRELSGVVSLHSNRFGCSSMASVLKLSGSNLLSFD